MGVITTILGNLQVRCFFARWNSHIRLVPEYLLGPHTVPMLAGKTQDPLTTRDFQCPREPNRNAGTEPTWTVAGPNSKTNTNRTEPNRTAAWTETGNRSAIAMFVAQVPSAIVQHEPQAKRHWRCSLGCQEGCCKSRPVLQWWRTCPKVTRQHQSHCAWHLRL